MNIKVIKKDNRIEPFYRHKIRTSLENVSDECNTALNLSDINLIINSISSVLSMANEEYISSVKIKELVYYKLKDFGYGKIANLYYSNK